MSIIDRGIVFIQKNRKSFWIFSVLFIALVCIWLINAIYQENQYNKEHSTFQELIREPIFSVAGTEKGTPEALEIAIEKLNRYIADVSSKRSQIRAQVYLLDFFLKKEDWTEAVKVSLALAKAVDIPDLKGYYYLICAKIYEKQENYIEAAKLYIKVREYTHADINLKSRFTLDQIRIHLAQGVSYADLLNQIKLQSDDQDQNIERDIFVQKLYYLLIEEQNLIKKNSE